MKDRTSKIFRLYAPIIHILISFIVEFLTYKDYMPYRGEMTALNDIGISLGAERLMLLVFCKAAGIILIFVIWRLIEKIVGDKDKLSVIIIVAAAVFAIIVYPYNFASDADSTRVYYMTAGYNPYYWHSVFVQAVYGACLTVVNHPLSIVFLQIVAFPLCIRYVIKILIENGFGKKAYIPVFFLILPEGYEYFCKPYRNNLYGILMMLLFSAIYVDFFVLKRKLTKYQIGLMVLWIAFLTVLRTEAVINVLVFAALCLFVLRDKGDNKEKIKAALSMSVLYAVLILVFLFPQKAGEYKYFGKDYSMINHSNVLQMILTDKNADVSYEGAKEDIELINSYYPIDYLKCAGINGFCCSLFERTGYSYQSLIDYSEQKKLVKAISRLEKHNTGVVLSTRLHWFIGTNRGPIGKQYVEDSGFVIPSYDALANDLDNEFYYGLGIIFESPFTAGLAGSSFMNAVNNFVVDKVIGTYMSLSVNLCLIWLMRVASIVVLISLELYFLSKGNMRKNAVVHLVTLSIIGHWCAMFLGTPTMLYTYYYAIFYMSILWNYYQILLVLKNRDINRAEQETNDAQLKM